MSAATPSLAGGSPSSSQYVLQQIAASTASTAGSSQITAYSTYKTLQLENRRKWSIRLTILSVLGWLAMEIILAIQEFPLVWTALKGVSLPQDDHPRIIFMLCLRWTSFSKFFYAQNTEFPQAVMYAVYSSDSGIQKFLASTQPSVWIPKLQQLCYDTPNITAVQAVCGLLTSCQNCNDQTAGCECSETCMTPCPQPNTLGNSAYLTGSIGPLGTAVAIGVMNPVAGAAFGAVALGITAFSTYSRQKQQYQLCQTSQQYCNNPRPCTAPGIKSWFS